MLMKIAKIPKVKAFFGESGSFCIARTKGNQRDKGENNAHHLPTPFLKIQKEGFELIELTGSWRLSKGSQFKFIDGNAKR